MSVRTTAPDRRRRPSPRGSLLAVLAAVLLGAAASATVAAVAPSGARGPVAGFGAAATVLVAVAVGVAASASRRAAAERLRADELAETAARSAADTRRLADETLPAVVKLLRDGASADTALAGVALPEDPTHQRIVRTLADEIGRGERLRAAAMSMCANAAGRVQALATSMMADLRDMEQRYGEDVLGDLLRLDHSTAQAGRLADSIAVLTGARSGRRWTKPIVMESILRGAVGRISAYQRVRIHTRSTAAVAGHAAEGVMHALAELMDNATSFSPPSEEVHVYVEERSAGVVVTIEDGGLVMSEQALRRAELAVSAPALDLTALSGTRMGLPVVGALARKHGLTVSFRPSSRGGTGVVVMIPQTLITRARDAVPGGGTDGVRAAGRPSAGSSGGRRGPDETRRPGRAPAPGADREVASAAPREAGTAASAFAPNVSETADPAPPFETDAAPRATGTLPKRPRGSTLAAAPEPKPEPRPEAPRPRTNPGARFGAFRQAVQGDSGGGKSRPDRATGSPDTGDAGERSD